MGLRAQQGSYEGGRCKEEEEEVVVIVAILLVIFLF